MFQPEIALIGGASGTGKTTTSRLLTSKYGFHHSIGTGFIREISKNYINRKQNIYLHSFSFETDLDKSGYELLLEQSKELINPIQRCIERARREGTNLVIEGVNILPHIYDIFNPDIKIILQNKDPDNHIKMCISESHSRRKVTNENFKNSRLIQNQLIKEANQFKWPTMESKDVDLYIRNLLKKST